VVPDIGIAIPVRVVTLKVIHTATILTGLCLKSGHGLNDILDKQKSCAT
jgi:hypothetical protein